LLRASNQVFCFRHDMTQGNADSQFTWMGVGMGWQSVVGGFDLDQTATLSVTSAGRSTVERQPRQDAFC
jgi:hypothetical protein